MWPVRGAAAMAEGRRDRKRVGFNIAGVTGEGVDLMVELRVVGAVYTACCV
jgi:hypothetical protein